MTKILVVDDDAKLLNMLRRTLSYNGFEVITAGDGAEALAQIASQQPAAVVLDWLMPKQTGVDVAQQLRAEGNFVPILMLTARDAVEDRVLGLECGADDYLVKPFAPAELIARLRALLRRIENLPRPENPPPAEQLGYADLTLNLTTREVRRGVDLLELTPTEFDLLVYFLHHPRQVLTRDQLLNAIWGYNFGGEANVLEVYVGYLRKKTESNQAPRLIQTVRGIGYVLRQEEG